MVWGVRRTRCSRGGKPWNDFSVLRRHCRCSKRLSSSHKGSKRRVGGGRGRATANPRVKSQCFSCTTSPLQMLYTTIAKKLTERRNVQKSFKRAQGCVLRGMPCGGAYGHHKRTSGRVRHCESAQPRPQYSLRRSTCRSQVTDLGFFRSRARASGDSVSA